MKLFRFLYKSKIPQLGFFVIILVLTIFSSCSPVKYVPDGEYLLDRYRVKLKSGSIKKAEVKNYIRQKPNKRVLGIRFHLWLYNLSQKDKEKGINNWLRTIGEEPVIYDSYLSDKSKELITTFLNKKGFYNAVVKDSIQLKRKRARISYNIEIKEPYKIRGISYSCSDSILSPEIMPDTIGSVINVGDNFDYDLLVEERQRVETILKNKGYYSFNKDFIFFDADSSMKNQDVHLHMNIQKYQEKREGRDIVSTNHIKYKINKVYVFTNFDQKEALAQKENYYQNVDTTFIEGIYFISKGEDRLNRRVILQSNFIQENELYSLKNTNKTYKDLNSLRLFKIINIQYNEVDSVNKDSLNLGYLNCNIQLTKSYLQSYTTEFQLTNSYGNIGFGGNLLYQHRSLFGGAEITDFRINGSIETIDTSIIEFKRISYTTEIGGNVTVSIPKFILPVFKAEKFSKKYSPKTQISFGYNYQDRLEYRRSIANMSYGYIWDGNNNIQHSIKLLELNAVNMPFATTDFKNYIDSTYLKSSYDNHLVSVTNYSLVYNNQDIKKKRDFSFFRLNAEVSGNLLSGISEVTGAIKNSDGKYLVFGIPFSQYVKFDFDFRYYNIRSSAKSLVYRGFVGIGIPYGNSESLPFEKMYFSGGANSIRAWKVRDLGPGSSKNISKTRFPNQTGDIKIEANIEYRYKMFWKLEGALFLDAGNVWTLNENKQYIDGDFELNRFYKEFAVGTGVGVRLDLSFVIARIDLGVKLRDPSRDTGERWIIGNEKLTWQDDCAINIGIGYPF